MSLLNENRMSSLVEQTAAIVRDAERGFETSKTLQKGCDEVGRGDDEDDGDYDDDRR